jgi:hypothetical protein
MMGSQVPSRKRGVVNIIQLGRIAALVNLIQRRNIAESQNIFARPGLK